MYNNIMVDVTNQIMTITLNRPKQLNSLNIQMLDEMINALDRADADDNVRAIIMTGEGRAFCAGADLDKGSNTFKDGSSEIQRDSGGKLSLRIYDLKKPIIAAINGPAVGVGITMTLPMDIRIASTNAKIGFVFTRRGILPEACSGWFLPRLVGINQALEWVYSGRVFSAEEALQGRLVSRILPPDDLLEYAREVANEIVENTSPISITLSRQLMWRMLGADHPMESHKIESKFIGKLPDSYEGVKSFFEKRKPNFTTKVSSDMPDAYPWWEERPF
jgi:enoyl-CoA hydratase/carnithine racemase